MVKRAHLCDWGDGRTVSCAWRSGVAMPYQQLYRGDTVPAGVSVSPAAHVWMHACTASASAHDATLA